MKITAVEATPLHTEIPPELRVESGAGRKLARQMCLITIHTDEGLTGYGSASGPYDLGLLVRIVEGILAPLLVGGDVDEQNHLWHRLFRGEVSRNVGTRGLGIAALSGVDMALWDVRGKAASMPLYALLGGRYHTTGVRAYASSIYWDLPAGEAAEQACSWIDRGFTGVKLKVGGRERHADAARVAAIRATLPADADLLVDANQTLSRSGALALLPALEDAGVYWFEEPLAIDDIEGHALLHRAARTVRIATGENLYTLASFMPFLAAEAVDVLQADVSRAGGIGEVRAIAEVARAHHLEWAPHTFNDILTVVANLHLVAASAHPARFEWDITYNELMTGLVADGRLSPVDGFVQPPSGPGLGVELDPEFVSAHRWRGEPAITPGHGAK